MISPLNMLTHATFKPQKTIYKERYFIRIKSKSVIFKRNQPKLTPNSFANIKQHLKITNILRC